MKRLLFICGLVFLASAAQGQTPVALAPVPKPVFTQNGAPLVAGCLSTFAAGTTTPLASFTDSAGVSQNTNPIILDANGSPPSAIYLSAAAYKFQLKSAGGVNCVSGSTVWTADNVSAAAFLNLPNTWTALQTFSAGIVVSGGVTVTGSAANTFPNLDQIRFVDGTTNATPQAAITACPATDCWVMVPPGTYPAPTNMRSNLRVSCYTQGVPDATITAATNLVWGTAPADNKCIFTSAVNITLSGVYNLMLEGMTFDFGSNNAGIVLQNGSFNNSFDITIQNCGTGACLTLQAGGAANQSVVANKFPNLFIFNAGRGILFNGAGSTDVASNNRFGYLFINNISIRGIEFQQLADTNTFDWVFIAGLANTAQAIAFNTQTPAVDTGCTDNVFRHLGTDVFNPGSYTGTLVQINKSSGNTFMAWSVGTGVVSGGGTVLGLANSPLYTINYASDFTGNKSNVSGSKRFYGTGTNLVNGDFAFSAGFGNTPVPAITSLTGTDAEFHLQFTSGGAGMGANPTVTLTFHDLTWSSAPVCVPARNDASAPAGGYWAPNPSPTALILTFVGTPVISTGYGVDVICQGKQN